ncbi:T9SS type A sorting domain-containing protein [Marixanthomonas spongiae]|uniref:Secretion system C-terminal sorting domain-containing protein n=1 Tax=Marixanthomonas spongiae TaxID=2174845 RepID=A0A2U0I2B4_9FLAO|nr:T9SS type A sorting domain-containing protein [Marixanthomonas spongiae]PVW15247.1 hypothetical protein DDV96_07525 [Marixanthomonas spongiae]
MNRKFYLLSITLFLSVLTTAQTATFVGGGSDNRWRTAANWDIGTIPGASHDVILPNGSDSEIFGLATTLQVKSITMQGNALLTVIGKWGIEETSVVGANATIHWQTGTLSGPGTLINEGTIANQTISNKTIAQGAVIQNDATYLLPDGSGDFLIEGLFENTATGTLSAIAPTSGSNPLINSTTTNGILRNFGTIEANALSLLLSLENEGGTINVQSGTCIINDPNSKLNGGEYNIDAGAEMQWIGGTTTLSGTLVGNLMGPLNWFGNVKVPTTATIDFGGSEKLYWKDNTLSGGGTLILASPTNIDNGTDGIIETTMLQNESQLNLNSSINIVDGIFLNTSTGMVFLNDNAGFTTAGAAAIRKFLNEGTVQKSVTTTTPVNSIAFENNGTVNIEAGTLAVNSNLGFENATNGIVKGIGTLAITANTPMVNNGTFSPGLSPGILSFTGNFNSESNAKILVELDGLAQGTEYDMLQITGDANFQGTIEAILGFEPLINDEFIVATTSGNITGCNLPTTITASIGNLEYTFSVACRNDNQLVLTTQSSVLGNHEFNTLNNVKVYPNPVFNVLSIEQNPAALIEQVQLLTIDGKLIQNFKTETQEQFLKVPVQFLPSGLYLIRLVSEHEQTVKKIVKR